MSKSIFIRSLLTVFVVGVLFSCGHQTKQTSQNTPRDIPHAIVYTTPAGDKIIFLEDYYRVYFKAIKSNYNNRVKLYYRDIADSIFNEYFTKSEYSGELRNRLFTGINDTTKLGDYIYGITNNRQKIQELITTALTESRRYLKNDSVTIYILPANYDIHMTMDGVGGVSGFTPGSKQIILIINTEESQWKENVSLTIAHEFNHTYWTKVNFYKSYQRTLLDYLVFEGKAESYAHLIYPNIPAPWTKALPEKVEADLWNKIKSQLKNQDMAYQYEVMFGSKNEYPFWGGYTLGYHIIQSALKNRPELTPAEWTNLPSEKILEMSNYK